MSIKLQLPKLTDLKPRIIVIGVGGAGGNAVNNMIASGLGGVDYIVANTDAQALAASGAERRIQLGVNLTEGLGAGSKPEIGEAAAEEACEDIRGQIAGAHMVFIAAGMGGGTGTGAAGVIARIAREAGVLTVGIVTKPFQFEGSRRMRTAEAGIAELRKYVDTLIVIPNQNLFRVANEKTTFAEAFVLADQVLYSGIACIVDLIVKEGLINLDFADVRTVMSGMGTAMMGTGEASGERRAIRAAEEAIANPLLDEVSLQGAKGLLLSIIGGRDMTLYEVDEAASRVRQEVDSEANIIVGATFDESMGDRIRVAIVASGLVKPATASATPAGLSAAPRPVPLPPPAAVHAQPHAVGSSTPPPLAGTSAPATGPAFAQIVEDLARGNGEDGARRHMGEQAYGRDLPSNAAPFPPQVPPARSMREVWRSPGDVVIEQALPAGHGGPAERNGPAVHQLHAQDSFRPAPPEDVQRIASRRMPEIEEFPAVGQREYHAKSGQPPRASDGPPPVPPRGSDMPPPESPRRGLFQRFTGIAPVDAAQQRRGQEKASGQAGFFKRDKG